MRILLVIPPLTQINTPYPSTAYLSGFLKGRGYAVDQVDLGIEMILLLFSSEGLKRVFEGPFCLPADEWSENADWIFAQRERYISTIDRVIRFLQHKDPTLAYRINSGAFLPRANRFEHMEDLELAFGLSGQQDKARYLATLYLEDLGDFITECIDPDFGFSRYADRIGMSASSFDPIEERLVQPLTLVQLFLRQALEEAIQHYQPTVVGFTVPFPGNLFAALWCGGYLTHHYPGIQKILGGGFVNTELRNLQDPRIFDWVDYITVDDGEGPILRLLDHLEGQAELDQLHRTFVRVDGQVQYLESNLMDIPQTEVGIPDYSGLPLDRYLSVVERSNPMHRLWSDGRWNKLTVAHGCYWKRCSFCDVSLDYIGRYEPSPASLLADRIEAILEATGESGFHFVDEAAPPKVLRDLALELIHRNLQISWWANIRFEKTFDADLCKLLAASGCIAVSGGLEVASDRLLELMEKGVSIRQVAKVTESFTHAGIMVHAYLMYGFPTQTAQETIDSLEIVRQLFANGLIQSAFWHRFALTAHSPVGLNPDKYKVQIVGPEFQGFARNDLQHVDPTGADHSKFSKGLETALYNYMLGAGIDLPVHEWFAFKAPKTQHTSDLLFRHLHESEGNAPKPAQTLYWQGPLPSLFELENDTVVWQSLQANGEAFEMALNKDLAEWLFEKIDQFGSARENRINLKTLQTDFEALFDFDFHDFLNTELMETLRAHQLLFLNLPIS